MNQKKAGTIILYADEYRPNTSKILLMSLQIGCYTITIKKGTDPHEENSPCNTTEQQRRGYATSMRFVSFSAF